MKLKKILIIGIVLIIIGLLFVGIVMKTIASSKCKALCEGKGTKVYDIIPNKKWNTKDACICYFPDKNEIEVSILN